MKTPFELIFDEVGFSAEERKVFLACLDRIKESQEDGKDPVSDVVKMVRELSKNEIQ